VIKYVTKDQMEKGAGSPHFFGYAIPNKQIGFVRKDLPLSVKLSVAAHEQFHLDDMRFYSSSPLNRELRAFIHQLKAEPRGTIRLLFMSLSPARLQLLAKRIIRGA
jgi:hypothetical protein